MGTVSYTAHISNKKSAITGKGKLKSVANHNLRNYRSNNYSRENVMLLYGSENLYKDVQEVYHREFDAAVKEYNEKQKRPDRRINDYFEHVAKLDQDMAVEIIFQCGDKSFWEEHNMDRHKIWHVYNYIMKKLQEYLPDFKLASAVIHFDEASPHMHVVGVPVWEGAKKGLAKKVSKRHVFTPETLSLILQDKLREEANECFRFNFKEELSDKKQGRGYDLTVAEYKVKQETERLENLQLEVKEEEYNLSDLEKQVTDKKEELEEVEREVFASRLAYRQVDKARKEEQAEFVARVGNLQREIAVTSDELDNKREELAKVRSVFDKVKAFIGMFRLFAPTIEEYANQVEKGAGIEAGNSFRGCLNELGRLLECFKELIKEGICWFPRLLKWKISVGEVAPVFTDNKDGYYYGIYGYMNVETKAFYSKESVQTEITACARVETIEHIDSNMAALEKDIKEILRLNGEQRRLWEAYEKR